MTLLESWGGVSGGIGKGSSLTLTYNNSIRVVAHPAAAPPRYRERARYPER